MVRNSIGRVPVFYTGSCEFESHRANNFIGALAEMVLLHSVEGGTIVVRFHEAPQN